MATLVHELDLPLMLPPEGAPARRFDPNLELPADAWIVRNLFGFAVWHYDDVTSILRDKRWHSA
ncbi:MAG: hypothetical protein Q8M22_19805, partial [Actinomycetota bacterium]|nr:hypothetical protein [Actinomycetota bacterium]